MGFLETITKKENFSSSIESLKENTQNGIENTIAHFTKFVEQTDSSLENAIEEMRIAPDKKLVFKTLQLWVNWLGKNGISPSSIPIMFSHLRTHLYYHGIEISNQDRKRNIKYPKINSDEKHGLSKEEFKAILNVASPKRKALYLMMSSSSLRIAEAVQVKKEDLAMIDKDHFSINVRGETTKTGKGRKIFMSSEATKAVIPYWKKAKEGSYIFATSENIRNAKTAEHERFKDYRNKAELTKKYDSGNRFEISLHSFRAFFITKVSRTDPSLAKRLAGQKAYLDVYDRLDDVEKLEVYKKLEPQLFIYEQIPESKVTQDLKQELQRMTQKMALRDRKIEHDHLMVQILAKTMKMIGINFEYPDGTPYEIDENLKIPAEYLPEPEVYDETLVIDTKKFFSNIS